MQNRPIGSRAERAVWYAAGLRFTCTRCRQCCTGAPGYVWVTQDEIARMAAASGLSVQEFADSCCRRVWLRVSLKERDNGDCILLGEAGCRLYSMRPSQCRAFPFWEANLRSRQAWESVKARCPGVGRGHLYTRQEIEQILALGQST